MVGKARKLALASFNIRFILFRARMLDRTRYVAWLSSLFLGS